MWLEVFDTYTEFSSLIAIVAQRDGRYSSHKEGSREDGEEFHGGLRYDWFVKLLVIQ